MGESKGILGSGSDKTTGLLIISTVGELLYNESTFVATGLFPHDIIATPSHFASHAP